MTKKSSIRTIQQTFFIQFHIKDELAASIAEEMEPTLNEVNVINIIKYCGKKQTGKQGEP